MKRHDWAPEDIWEKTEAMFNELCDKTDIDGGFESETRFMFAHAMMDERRASHKHVAAAIRS